MSTTSGGLPLLGRPQHPDEKEDSMTRYHEMTPRDRRLAVICRLGVDCTPDYVTEDPDELLGFVARVLEEENITYADFVELDERPGQFPGGYDGIHGEWHFRLRRWRNDPTSKLQFAKPIDTTA